VGVWVGVRVRARVRVRVRVREMASACSGRNISSSALAFLSAARR
jgi:hypothetical protein